MDGAAGGVVEVRHHSDPAYPARSGRRRGAPGRLVSFASRCLRITGTPGRRTLRRNSCTTFS
jgi:hypothetical protein